MGKVFYDDMISAGINAQLSQSDTSTGRAIALISPDTERTFATYLGAAIELNSMIFHQSFSHNTISSTSKDISSRTMPFLKMH